MKIIIDGKKIDPSPLTKGERVEEVLTQGVEEIVSRENLKKKMTAGEKLRVKFGIDPTGAKIHIGRATAFWKLRQFQDLGHQVVLIIGDYTAQIGDASDKTSMRKPLTPAEIRENLKDYKKQIGKILNMRKVELHYNSEWLRKLSARDLIQLAMDFTAQQMIQRRNFKERWDKGSPIGLHELTYPLLQGYDSFAIKSDLEIGGTDQLFNLQAGREIQKLKGQKPQDIMLLEMMYGLDGRKMSTSWGNVINIIDEPGEQYGKIMSMKDEMIENYTKSLLGVPVETMEEIKKQKETNPMAAKARLAGEIVKVYHGEKAAEQAEEEFSRVFQEKEMPSEIAEIKIDKNEMNILDLLVELKLAESKSEAKRLVEQNGVKINNEIVSDWQKNIKIEKGMVAQVGRRRFAKII